MSHSFQSLRAAVRESGKDRDLISVMIPKLPEGLNGGCGTPTHVEGTNGGTMPCGNMLTRFGVTAPYYCPSCQKERK
jgi:hypothetical protein